MAEFKPEIYDDPNQLVGGCVDMMFTRKTTLHKIAHNLPPNTKNGKELFKKWLESSIGKDWCEGWEYLKSLDIEDYLEMYAELPSILLKEAPKSGTVADDRLQQFIQEYSIQRELLNQNINYNLPNKKNLYDSPDLTLYKYRSDIRLAELDLCRAIVRHPKYTWNEIFKTPIYLWFWVQVANCLKYLKQSGVLVPITAEEILTKNEERKQWGQLLTYYNTSLFDYKDSLPNQIQPSVELKQANGLKDFLENIPAILPVKAADLLKLKYDLQLENAYLGYINSHHSLRFLTKGEMYQISTVYKEKKTNEQKLFTTGKKQKRPKY